MSAFHFFFVFSGGRGAVIRLVPRRENSRQGGLLRAFYQKYSIGNGDCFKVQLG